MSGQSEAYRMQGSLEGWWREAMRAARRLALAALLAALVWWAAGESIVRWIFPVRYADVIERHARQYNLDPTLLVAIVHAESGFNPSARSSKGARGLMQIMPETARWAAAEMGMEGFDVQQLDDPHVNVAIGAWYLQDLRRVFGGEVAVILAAYNGGRGNVDRWLREEIWTGSPETVAQIPFMETRMFVQKVRRLQRIYAFAYPELRMEPAQRRGWF